MQQKILLKKLLVNQHPSSVYYRKALKLLQKKENFKLSNQLAAHP